jgi:hypothetical protein
MNTNDIKAHILKHGGITLNPSCMSKATNLKYVVSLEGHECVYDLNYFLGLDLKGILTHYAQLGRKFKAFVGFWINGKKVYVDLSQSFETLEEALIVAKKRNQKAIYDAIKGESVPCE